MGKMKIYQDYGYHDLSFIKFYHLSIFIYIAPARREGFKSLIRNVVKYNVKLVNWQKLC
jgi:hypothetical protein